MPVGKWLQAIGYEFALVHTLTFNRNNLEKALRGGSDRGWLHDRHLRLGAWITFPPGFVALFLVFLSARKIDAKYFLLLFAIAIPLNLLWLAIAAWSRSKDPARVERPSKNEAGQGEGHHREGGGGV